MSDDPNKPRFLSFFDDPFLSFIAFIFLVWQLTTLAMRLVSCLVQ